MIDLTAEQRQLAKIIHDYAIRFPLIENGDAQLLKGCYDYMDAFKWVMDSASKIQMDYISLQYSGYFRFAKWMERLAHGIADGIIEVPKDHPKSQAGNPLGGNNVNFHRYNRRIEFSDEFDIPYYIYVTVRGLPAVINNLEVLNQTIQHTEFESFREIKPFSLMKIPYHSRYAYTTTYRRRVDRTIYQRGQYHRDHELRFFFNTLGKAGYIVQLSDRQVWDAEVEKL